MATGKLKAQVWLNPGDRDLAERIRQANGLDSLSQVLRWSLRYVERCEGLGPGIDGRLSTCQADVPPEPDVQVDVQRTSTNSHESS